MRAAGGILAARGPTGPAEGVKPGVQFNRVEDVVVATWAKPGASIPTTVFGVTVK